MLYSGNGGNRYEKRITAWIAAFVIVVAGLPLMPGTVLANTTTTVDYVSRAWNETTKTVDDTKVEKQVCNIVTSSNTSWGSAGTETWYVVTEDVTISERVIVSGRRMRNPPRMIPVSQRK